MTRCHICRAETGKRNPIVQCGEGYPWPHHCTVCRRACGGCNRATPTWRRVESVRRDELGEVSRWHGWVIAA